MNLNFRLLGVASVAGAFAMMLSVPAAAAINVQHSTNLAGYAATSATSITSFTGSIKMPTITCPATGSPFMFGEVELTGGPAYSVTFTWTADCGGSGTPTELFAAADFCPTAGGLCEPELEVSAAPGDTFQLSMSENTQTSTTTLNVTNSTESQSASASVHSLVSEFDITAGTSFCCGNAQGNITPIPSFAPIKFGNLKFNGSILSSFSPVKTEMFDGATLQVATSSISSTGGFSNTFKHV